MFFYLYYFFIAVLNILLIREVHNKEKSMEGVLMVQQTLHQLLQQASKSIQEAQVTASEAQGSNEILLNQAVQLLLKGEQTLEKARHQGGTEATENSQFQQAYEQLHDTRQQLQEAQQNNNDVL